VREEFDAYLRCGALDHGFLRVVCEQCRAERLVAFSCKQRGFCPSCGARRMAERARHLVVEVVAEPNAHARADAPIRSHDRTVWRGQSSLHAGFTNASQCSRTAKFRTQHGCFSGSRAIGGITIMASRSTADPLPQVRNPKP
jgi:hypothetical protein